MSSYDERSRRKIELAQQVRSAVESANAALRELGRQYPEVTVRFDTDAQHTMIGSTVSLSVEITEPVP